MGRNRKITKSDVYRVTKDILATQGYSGFHFGLLAERLDVTRAALYKYFDHKDELITQFMNEEMERLVDDLGNLDNILSFQDKLDYLLQIISKNSKTHKILSSAFQIQKTSHPVVTENLKHLRSLHEAMTYAFHEFIRKGKEEGYVREDLPDQLILGFLLQTVNIPNRTGMSDVAWLELVKSFLIYGFSSEQSLKTQPSDTSVT